MPGSYSIVQGDLRFSDDRLKQVTDPNGVAIATPLVDAAIVAAEEEFHLYAGIFYAVPVRKSDGSTPTGIKQKLINAARWYLMQNRPEFLRGDSDEGKLWEKARKEWTDWLESIAAANSEGKPRLPIPGAVETSTLVARDGEAEVQADAVFFEADTMRSLF